MCVLPNRKGASGPEEYFGSIGRKRIETELSASSATNDQPATRASDVLRVLANMFSVMLTSYELRRIYVPPRAL